MLAVGCWLLAVGCWPLAIRCWLVGFCWNTNDADFKDLRCFVLHIPQPSAFYELTEGKFTQIVLAFCVFYSSTHTFNCCAMPIRGRKLATRNPQLTSTSTSTSFPFTISTQRSLVIIIFSIKIRRFYTNCVILTKLLKCRNGNS